MYVVIKQFSTPKSSLRTEKNVTLIDDEDGIKQFPPPKLLYLTVVNITLNDTIC